MLSKYVAPGNRIEIQAIKGTRFNDKGINKMYKSLVWDTISDDRIEILVPIEKNKLIALPVNEEYDLYIFTSSGQFQCTATAVDRYKSENKHLLLLELTTSLKKIQRREYFRLSCALEIGTRLLVDEEINAILKGDKFVVPGLPVKKGIVVDISGGGMRFVGRAYYKPDSFICCQGKLVLDGIEKETVLAAKVLKVKELQDTPGSYEHRVQFVNLDAKEREEIIRYIFEEERKHRNRGKGL